MHHAGFVCLPIGNASNIWVNINSSSKAEEVDLRATRVKTEEYACCTLCKHKPMHSLARRHVTAAVVIFSD